jgi:hypothetical protein
VRRSPRRVRLRRVEVEKKTRVRVSVQ